MTEASDDMSGKPAGISPAGESETTVAPPAATRRSRFSWRWLRYALLLLLAFLVLYYAVGMVWVHQIDDDLDFGLTNSAPENGSRAVAIAADLIEREVNTNSWTANDPFFQPGSLLDNMPNFQQGIIAALSRFTIELADQVARTRGSSEIDPDVDRASGLLKYPGTVWIFDLKTSLAPTASSESQYRRALTALRNYNVRLGEGNATFEARADNLQATLERFNADIGSASAAVARELEDNAGFGLDFGADDLFYANKGRLYAYYLLLREFELDFAPVIQERALGNAWRQTLDSFRAAVELQPWVVVNGAPDGQFQPSHLAAQGFYLLRARTQLREIANILLK